MTRDEAIKIWEDVFEDEKWVQDCYGTWMYKEDYGDYETYRKRPNQSKKYKYGWEIDHIRPKSDFNSEQDSDFPNNYEPIHFVNNREKSDNKEFEIHGRNYKVVPCDICKKHNLEGYGIRDEKTGQRVDWKYTRKAYYEE